MFKKMKKIERLKGKILEWKIIKYSEGNQRVLPQERMFIENRI